MDWESPRLLLLAVPLLALLLWIENKSAHPMEGARKKALLLVRAVLLLLALLALAGPARVVKSDRRAVVMVVDHSQSLGETGVSEALKEAKELQSNLGSHVETSMVALGDEAALIPPESSRAARAQWQESHGSQTHLD